MKEGVVLIIRDNHDRILLAKRGYECKGYSGYWEFPGETSDKTDANPRITAWRGAKEELKLTIEPFYWSPLGEYTSVRWDKAYIYETDIGRRTPVINEPGFCDELQFVHLNDIYKYELTPESLTVLEILHETKDRREIYSKAA